MQHAPESDGPDLSKLINGVQLAGAALGYVGHGGGISNHSTPSATQSFTPYSAVDGRAVYGCHPRWSHPSPVAKQPPSLCGLVQGDGGHPLERRSLAQPEGRCSSGSICFACSAGGLTGMFKLGPAASTVDTRRAARAGRH